MSDYHFSELIRGASKAFIVRILGTFAGYLFTFFITRAYGSQVMGVFALSRTILLLSSIIGRLGLDTVAIRLTAEFSKTNRKDLRINVGATCFSGK